MRRHLVCLMAGLAIASGGCGRAPSGGPQRAMAVHVVAYQVASQPIEERLELVGTLAANEVIEIQSELDGAVEELRAEEGQAVRRGDMLFRIDEAKLQAAYREANANLELAKTTLERYRVLVANGAVSKQEYDQAQATYQTRLAAAELALEQLRDARITAPFDGVLGARLVSVGQFVTKGTRLTTLISQDPMKAEFRVPERYLSRVAVGQAVDLGVAAYPEERFAGTVFFIEPQIDEATRTALVKARVPNPDGRLRRGMFASLALIVSMREQALVIPESALLLRGDETSVFVIEGNTAMPRPVTTGLRLPGRVEVTGGLSEGALVVIEGTQKLAPGAAVSVEYATDPFGEGRGAAPELPSALRL